jgi:hypothetical protein
VCLDQQLLTAEYGGEVLVSLQSAEIQYNIQSNPVPFSIFWTREIQEHFVGDDMKVNSFYILVSFKKLGGGDLILKIYVCKNSSNSTISLK